ncbi:MAG: pyridoxamine 5'-phosphate oxidase family protein [Deltaproteobacteria bacterium]|nr:pyridoxamine 5'-phosphate oxidase family protein [Deltaproteobacteria bacterium]
MKPIVPTLRTTHRRLPDRGSHERDVIEAILDEGLVCHVGFAHEGQPYVIPMSYARMGDRLVLHGAPGSRLLQELGAGAPVCVTVTLLDGLVLARSAMHHSVNYRSVVLLGRASAVQDEAEKRAALRAIVEHVVPGRSAEARPPSEAELGATLVLAVPIEEASAKVRAGPPKDDEEDHALPCWAGVLPLSLSTGTPVPDPRLRPGTPVPLTVAGYRRGR